MFGYVWGSGVLKTLSKLKLLPRWEYTPALLRWLFMPCMSPGDARVMCLFCGGDPLHGSVLPVRVVSGVDGDVLFLFLLVVIFFGWIVGDCVACSGEGVSDLSELHSGSCSTGILSAHHGDVLCNVHGIGIVHCVAHVTAMHVCDVIVVYGLCDDMCTS